MVEYLEKEEPKSDPYLSTEVTALKVCLEQSDLIIGYDELRSSDESSSKQESEEEERSDDEEKKDGDRKDEEDDFLEMLFEKEEENKRKPDTNRREERMGIRFWDEETDNEWLQFKIVG